MFSDFKRDIEVHKRSVSYEGMLAMFNYRFGVWAYGLPQPFRFVASKMYAVGRVLTTMITHIHLERNTKIGKDIHFIHGGVVHIHDKCVIGDRCGIMHGVTLGAATNDGVPTVGDDVFIGANAVILGRVKIGNGARIAANALVLSDVPPGFTAIGNPAKMVPPLGMTMQEKKQNPAGNTSVPAKPSADQEVAEKAATAKPAQPTKDEEKAEEPREGDLPKDPNMRSVNAA